MKRNTTNRTRKRALIGVGAAALLLGGAYVGVNATGTGATFTSTASSPANPMTAGTVHIAVTDDGSTPLTPIALTNMAPGDTAYKAINVKNTGTLALRYAVSETTSDETLGTDPDDASNRAALFSGLTVAATTITGTTCDATSYAAGTAVTTTGAFATGTGTAQFIGDPAPGAQSGDRSLAPGDSETLCLQMTLPAEAGNAFQGATDTATLSFAAEQTQNN